MEVQFLKYDGKDLPIRVGYRALKKSKEDNPDETIEFAEDGTVVGGKIEDNETLLYHSLTSGQYAVDKTLNIPYKKEEMEFILDECFIEFMVMVNEFTNSVQGEGIEIKKVIPNRGARRKEEKDNKSKKK